MIELMKLKATFMQSEIQDGDIICFQIEMNEKEYVFIFFIMRYCITYALNLGFTTQKVRGYILTLFNSMIFYKIAS